MNKEKESEKNSDNQSKNKSSRSVIDKDAEENKAIAAIGYIGILFLVPLLAKKDSPFALFHAKQGLVVCIIWIGYSIVSIFLTPVPIVGPVSLAALFLIILILNIMGIINALGGKKEKLPVIGEWAEKLNI
ncbi:MAG: DUF4870 domain-containing protein [Candidatus Moranbacteria bacterium]|nr:DUF4870 domain-containing protein [Candidatus Moranbacteria bacterium]